MRGITAISSLTFGTAFYALSLVCEEPTIVFILGLCFIVLSIGYLDNRRVEQDATKQVKAIVIAIIVICLTIKLIFINFPR